MFYEENEITKISECKKCRLPLHEPRVLPCGDTICSSCVDKIHVDNKQFFCILCLKKHYMPDEGLPLNKMALQLASMKPTEVSRGRTAEGLKKTLRVMSQKITTLIYDSNNGIDKINEYYSNLRSDVQLAAEEVIQQINERNQNTIEIIDNHEKETIKAYQLSQAHKNQVKRTVEELEKFHLKWSKYLNQAQISDDLTTIVNREAEHLNKKAETEQLNLTKVIFKEGRLKFIKNSKKLEWTALGYLHLEAIQDNNSYENIIDKHLFNPFNVSHVLGRPDPIQIAHQIHLMGDPHQYMYRNTDYINDLITDEADDNDDDDDDDDDDDE